MMQKIDLIGERFGRLAVVAEAPRSGGKVRWECLCDCGSKIVATTSNLRTAHTASCGCMRSEINSRRAIERNTVHGHNKVGGETPTHRSWASMLKRCSNGNHKSFKDYGGRGIKVCDQWRNFETFLADMGERPLGRTLDRIDVNGNYDASNCRWATLSEQQKNKRPRA